MSGEKMTMQTEAQRNVLPDARLTVSKRFGRFKDEEEHAVRGIPIVEDRVLEQLVKAWAKVPFDDVTYACSPLAEHHSKFVAAINGIRYTSKDVEKFSIALTAFQHERFFSEKAGIFLSALISGCPDSDFVIHTMHLDEKIRFLGFHNTKNITVAGDIGGNICNYMLGGRIIVEGNAERCAGQWMESGEIVINGMGGASLGHEMKGGKISVKGNASQYAGSGMENGEIAIEGDADYNLGYGMKGGKIIVKGNATPHSVGPYMKGGEIWIEGECKHLPEYVWGGPDLP